MRVEQVTLSLAAALVATTAGVNAGPQSQLDPYANVKPPTTKELQQRKEQQVKKSRPYATPPLKNPAADLNAIAPDKSSTQPGGFVAGTKQVFHGIGTATKGAASDIVHPVKTFGTGIANGGRKVGSTVVNGAKASGETLVKGVHKVGDGVKAAGGKVIDTTGSAGKAVSAVPRKLGEGLKAAGDKVKEGGEKIASSTKAAGSKVKESAGSVGEKVTAVPKKIGEGIASAAEKTGEAAKKVATAPIHLASKLNPFHRKDDHALQTAATPAATDKPQ